MFHKSLVTSAVVAVGTAKLSADQGKPGDTVYELYYRKQDAWKLYTEKEVDGKPTMKRKYVVQDPKKLGLEEDLKNAYVHEQGCVAENYDWIPRDQLYAEGDQKLKGVSTGDMLSGSCAIL